MCIKNSLLPPDFTLQYMGRCTFSAPHSQTNILCIKFICFSFTPLSPGCWRRRGSFLTAMRDLSLVKPHWLLLIHSYRWLIYCAHVTLQIVIRRIPICCYAETVEHLLPVPVNNQSCQKSRRLQACGLLFFMEIMPLAHRSAAGTNSWKTDLIEQTYSWPY